VDAEDARAALEREHVRRERPREPVRPTRGAGDAPDEALARRADHDRPAERDDLVQFRGSGVCALTHFDCPCMTRQIFSGVAGISMCRTPRSESASQIALMIAGATAGWLYDAVGRRSLVRRQSQQAV